MKISLLFIVLTLLFYHSTTAQTFPDYYIVEPTTEIAVFEPAAEDIFGLDTSPKEMGKGMLLTFVNDSLTVRAGEVVMVIDRVSDHYVAMDPYGRKIFFKGGLTKVKRMNGSWMGQMQRSVKLADSLTLPQGMYVWVMGQSMADKTYQVQYSNGREVAIPFGDVELMNNEYGRMIRNRKFRKIESTDSTK